MESTDQVNQVTVRLAALATAAALTAGAAHMTTSAAQLPSEAVTVIDNGPVDDRG